MSDWTDRLAQTLGVAPIGTEQQALLLHASREIAHRIERKETPLSTFLLGVAAGARMSAGADVSAALREVVDLMLALLPPEAPEPSP